MCWNGIWYIPENYYPKSDSIPAKERTVIGDLWGSHHKNQPPCDLGGQQVVEYQRHPQHLQNTGYVLSGFFL